MTRLRTLAALFVFTPLAVLAADPPPAVKGKENTAQTPKPDPVAGYKTVAELIKADPRSFRDADDSTPIVPGFIGVEVSDGDKAKVTEVLPDSPADKGGLKPGDELNNIGDAAVTSAIGAKDQLRGLVADEPVKIGITRGDKSLTLTVTPKPASKPFNPDGSTAPASNRALLGVRLGDAGKDGGVVIDSITGGGGAEKAGLKDKDLILEIDGAEIDANNSLADLLSKKRPGDVVTVKYSRDGKEGTTKVSLTGEQPVGRFGGRPGGFGGGWDDRLPRAWNRKDYKLAVIGIEYPDQKHNEKTTDKDWEESLFSLGTYTDKSATGQTVYGSMADYYKEISYGQLKVEGAFIGWMEAKKKRTEYSTGTGTSSREKSALLTEVMDKVLEVKGKDALSGYDGVFFLYAGGSIPGVTRGSLYWPHRATVRHNGKSWPYFIVQEGGSRMTDISVFCHEFGHMLGLPDLYARPEVPGMEGVGVWCAMSQQLRNGRPQHFSAWSKMQLGWAKPTMIDPRVKQKIVLSPIEDDASQCLKVPLRTDGGEYLLLENRRKSGFDTGLPAEGLLIWRVMPGNRTQPVYLEESHGIEGRGGPAQFTSAVPFPSSANDSFTPYTTPSSKAKAGGGLDVFITNIQKRPDGRITFHIGYEYQ